MKKWAFTLLGAVLCSWALANATVTVQKGDSLGSIAARYGTTVVVLQRLNGLSGINIRVGQVLKLPGSSRVTVQSGDSLQSIAARNGVSVDALRSANGISGDRIRVGQELRLPSASAATSSQTASSSRVTSGTVEVKSGDTLGEIATRLGVSLEALRAANGLENDSIRVGQILKIPGSSRVTATPTSPTSSRISTVQTSTVEVKSGDTLSEIATRNNTTVEILQALNGLSGINIRVGQVLKVPASAAPKPSAAQAKPTTITVQKGDTLDKIAKRYNISLATLRAANNLTTDSIRIGDTLRLSVAQPKPASSQKLQAAKPKPSSKPAAKPAPAKPSTKPAATASKPSPAKPSTSSKPASKPAPSSAVKPSANTGKPAPASSSKPTSSSSKPATSAAKPSPNKPATVSSSGTNKPAPSSAAKPSTSKPAVVTSSAAKPTPTTTSASKPSPSQPNTRVINPPPNLPSATGRVVTIAPSAVVARPPAKPSQVQSKPTTTTTQPSVATKPPAPTVATVKPTAPVAAASSQSAPKPTMVAPPTAVRPVEPSPTVTARPADMPSTLGFSEPTEAPEDAPLIDPSLESPFLDATAPSSTPTAPSDLVEDVEIEIPENLSAATVKPAPVAPNAPPTYSRAEKVLWPLSGVMTSRFGWRRLRGNRFHTGIDLAAPKGTRVYAALSGRIEFAGWNRQGYGYLVIVRGWDNRQYYYGHNSRLLVRRGQWVRQGQVISRVGSTGFSTGPHLHFEIRVGGRARNPLAYLPRSRLAQASAVR